MKGMCLWRLERDKDVVETAGGFDGFVGVWVFENHVFCCRDHETAIGDFIFEQRKRIDMITFHLDN